MLRKGLLKRSIAAIGVATMLVGTAAGCGSNAGEELKVEDMDFNADMSGIATGSLNAGSSVHDPSIVVTDDKYYIVGTHMTFAYSDDLRKWTLKGNGYTATNMIFGSLFKDETGEVFRYTGKKDSVVPTDDGGCHLWRYGKAQSPGLCPGHAAARQYGAAVSHRQRRAVHLPQVLPQRRQ